MCNSYLLQHNYGQCVTMALLLYPGSLVYWCSAVHLLLWTLPIQHKGIWIFNVIHETTVEKRYPAWKVIDETELLTCTIRNGWWNKANRTWQNSITFCIQLISFIVQIKKMYEYIWYTRASLLVLINNIYPRYNNVLHCRNKTMGYVKMRIFF